MLPNLVKIGCGIDVVGPELADIADEDLPDHIASTYRTVGKNLQIWRPQGTGRQQFRTIPEYAMLMALVCPKLCRVEVTPNIISDFQTRVYEELQSGPFSEYASQLEHLLQAAY
ncbi:hypothetical protein FBU31_000737 [Coemansia sp. 'formosensis']|nr:hypothetical protein FBU31_000737 [Coemansia sp. 'formosensis']